MLCISQRIPNYKERVGIFPELITNIHYIPVQSISLRVVLHYLNPNLTKLYTLHKSKREYLFFNLSFVCVLLCVRLSCICLSLSCFILLLSSHLHIKTFCREETACIQNAAQRAALVCHGQNLQHHQNMHADFKHRCVIG